MSFRKKRKIVESDSDEEQIFENDENLEISDSESSDDTKILLHKLQIENFKSYKNFEEVGPFDEIFTWYDDLETHKNSKIVLLVKTVQVRNFFRFFFNFSQKGKSNLLDAICFGLGFDAKKIRSKSTFQFLFL